MTATTKNKIKLSIITLVTAIILVGIILATLVLRPFSKPILVANQNIQVSINDKTIDDIDVLGASIINNSVQIVDVRTLIEYTKGHIAGAINIPLDVIKRGDYTGFSTTTPIYLYCRSGSRAKTAKTILEQAGFTDVTNLGSLANWQASGGDVITTDLID